MAEKISKAMLEKHPQLEQIFAAIEEYRVSGNSTILCPKCNGNVQVIADRDVGILETICGCDYCKYRMSWNPRVMINTNDFPYVRSFLSAYFHQDWLDEYTSLDEAIEEYCSCGNIEDRKLALCELKSLTRLAEAGEFNEADLLSFSCYFQPSVNNITLSDWLEYVSTFIANKLNTR